MIRLSKNTTLAAALLLAALSGCSTFRQPAPDATVTEVTDRLGKPNAVYPDPDGSQWLEYRGQPMGQFQHMAHVGPDGRLLSYEQVLTSKNFARIQVNDWTRDEVLRNFGRPAEVSRDRATGWEVWSYRYKQDDVWNSYKDIYFNARGVVRRTEDTADPLLDDRFKGL